LDASSWELYVSGVNSSPCTKVDHVALVVGYTPDHWIVQNTWGSSWGIQGYINIARGKNNANCIAYLGFAPIS